MERFETAVERSFQIVFISPVEPFDQEMQAGLALFDIECEQRPRPGGERFRGPLPAKRQVVRFSIAVAALECPGIDDAGNGLTPATIVGSNRSTARATNPAPR